MQRLTLSYLAGYLLVGGLGFLVAPDVALRLLLSNGAYGDIMPRVVGLFMLVLGDRKSTRLNSSHGYISYAVFCLKKKKKTSKLTIKIIKTVRNPRDRITPY